MRTVLNIFRWLLVVILLILLIPITIVGIISSGASRIIANEESVPDWLSKTNIYEELPETAIEIALSELERQSDQETADKIEAQFRTDLLSAAQKLLTPEWLDRQVRSVAKGVYAWLNGETDRPLFVITLQGQEQEVESVILEYVHKKIETSPTCTPEQEAELRKEFQTPDGSIPLEKVNIFGGECIPTQVDRTLLRTLFDLKIDEIFAQDGVLQKAQFDSKDLKLQSQMLEDGPKIFKIVKFLPYISCCVILILLGLQTFLSPKRYGTAIFACATIILISLIVLVLAKASVVGADILFELLKQQLATQLPEQALTLGKSLLDVIFDDLLDSVSLISLLYMLGGGILIVISIITKYIQTQKRSYRPRTAPTKSANKSVRELAAEPT